MSQFLGEATVAVKADTKLFRDQLAKAVADAEKLTVAITVSANTKPFTTQVAKAIADAKKLTVDITVTADTKPFKTQIAAAIAEAQKSVATITVAASGKATGAAAGAAATGGVVDKRAAEAQLAVNKAVAAGTAARRPMIEAMTLEEKRATRLIREELHLAAAIDAVKKAAVSDVPALLTLAEAEERAARANVARTQGQIAASAAAAAGPVQAAAAATAEQAAAEADLLAAREVTGRKLTLIENQRTESLAKSTTAAEKYFADQARAAIEESAVIRESAAKDIAAFRAEERAALANAAALQERARAQVAGARTFTPKIQEVPITSGANRRVVESTNALLRARAQLAHATSVTTTAEEAFDASLAVSNREMQSAAAQTLILAREQEVLQAELLKTAVIQEAAAKSSAKSAARVAGAAESAKKGLIAQSAAMIGLRGAALSANVAFIATVATLIGGVAALVQFAKFQSTLNTFRVTAGATADQMEAVRTQAEALGKDITLPGVGAQDAADAMTELSKAGLSVQNSINGARGVLELATAAGIDNAQATELAASALNAFGLSGDQAVRVADVLANAANDAQGSIVDMGVALQQASAVGRQAGLSLEQTTAVLTLFARNGLRGSDAGTSLRTALIRLINPTSKAQKEIQKLGLHIRTASGAINLGVFDEFTNKTKDMTKAARDQALAIIFGQDAIRGAAILAREGASGLTAEQKSLEKQGTAAALAGARMQGLSGDVENFKNQISALGLVIGAATAPLAGKFIQALTDGVVWLQRATKAAGEFFHSDLFSAANFDSANHGFDTIAESVAKLQKDLSTTGDFAFKLDFAVGLRAAEKDLAEAGKRLVAQGFLTRVVESFKRLSPDVKKAMEDNVISPAEQAQLSTTALGQAFLEATGLGQKGFASLGAVAKSSIEDASAGVRAGAPRLGRAMKDTIEEASAQAKAQAAQSGLELGDRIVFGIEQSLKLAQNRINRIVHGAARQARLRTGALQSRELDLQIQGASPQARLRNARAQQTQAERLLAIGKGAGVGRTELNKRKQAVIDAQNKVSSIQDEITTNQQKVAQHAKDQASKAQKARDEADQAFFDSLKPSQNRIQRQLTRAQGTAGLEDDRRALIAQRKNLNEEIRLIGQNVHDKQQAKDEISSRRNTVLDLNNQIDDLAQQINEATFGRHVARLERRVDIAKQFGDIAVERRVFTQIIKLYNERIKHFKGEKEKLQELKDARDAVIQERKGLRDTQLQQNVDLAQSIFDLTGNKNPLLKALNAEIADQRKQIIAAQKAGHSTKALRTALNGMLLERKNLLKNANDQAGKGTTAFDLLNEFNAKFSDIAGNLINKNQPFAGGSAFATDVVNKGIASFTGPPHRPIDLRLRGEDAQSQWVSVTKDLISAIRENTDVQRGASGNSSTISVTVPGEIAGKNKLAAYWANQARQVKDG